MAVSPENYPPRKRRTTSSGSFVSPNLSDHKLLQSLILLSQEISSLQPLNFLLKRNTSTLIRRLRLINIVFEELLRYGEVIFPSSAVLCFEELYLLLQRLKAILEDCICCSKLWLLMQIRSVSSSFHELTVELSTLIDIFPAKEFDFKTDVKEILDLIRKQCSEQKEGFLDRDVDNLRSQVLEMLNKINQEIVPDHFELSQIFEKLSLRDSTTCRDEIENLEEKFHNQSDESSKAQIVALTGFVRYAKCVLYGASTPRPAGRRRSSAADLNIPTDFRCPISLDLMRDPVVVSTGQTYDRASISVWIESGHNTCPKTGQNLANQELIPNQSLKNLMAMWCREQRIPFYSSDADIKGNRITVVNKTALEATKMTVLFLINNLMDSQSVEVANRMVYELRLLAKTDSDSRTTISEAGALPLLVKFLSSGYPSLQVNAVTTILNLSILEANKTRIMETEGVLNGVIEVLRTGATWEAKGNSAATIFSLISVSAYRKKLGRKTRIVHGLIDLAREGPKNTKRDALVAILNLAADKEAVVKLIEARVVDMVRDIIDTLPEEAVTILEVVVKRGGVMAVAAAYHVLGKLTDILRDGSLRAKESAAATLVTMCRRGGSEMVAELAAVTGVERVIWEIVGTGTGRGRRKAASLLRILRRWAAGVEGDAITSTSSTLNMNSTSSSIFLS